MRSELVVLFLIGFVALCNAFPEPQGEVEARGKKKKISLFGKFTNLLFK